jgi:hypothetical protein
VQRIRFDQLQWAASPRPTAPIERLVDGSMLS